MTVVLTAQPVDSVVFDVKPPEDVALSAQERAYTSPIWYTP